VNGFIEAMEVDVYLEEKKTMIDDMYGEHSIVFGREFLIEYACI
jgi:hypothetical protein